MRVFVMTNDKIQGPLEFDKVVKTVKAGLFPKNTMVSFDKLSWLSLEEAKAVLTQDSPTAAPPQDENKYKLHHKHVSLPQNDYVQQPSGFQTYTHNYNASQGGYAPQNYMVQPNMEQLQTVPAPGPWTRWVARMIDFNIENFIVVLLIRFILLWIGFDAYIIYKPLFINLFLSVISGAFAFLIDSFVYSIIGNTLGKWLMGVCVVNVSGAKISGGEYFKRNMQVYWGGFGLFIPCVSLITLIIQFNRVNKQQESTYDELLQMKSVRYNAYLLKTFFGVVLFFAVLISNIACSCTITMQMQHQL